MACSRCGAFLVVAAGQYQTIKKKCVILKTSGHHGRKQRGIRKCKWRFNSQDGRIVDASIVEADGKCSIFQTYLDNRPIAVLSNPQMLRW